MASAKPPNLGEFEQLVMLALLRLGDDGYGMQVRRAIEERTGRDTAIGAVYATLDRLEEKGLVTSAMEKADGEARPRRIYRLTAPGLKALRAVREAFERMSEGLSLGLEGGKA